MGPASIVGLRSSEIVTRVPEPGASEVETNYFCAVEFAAPDFPWRYTPAAAADDKLMPWLSLVVVEDRPGVRLDTSGLVDVIDIDDASIELPPADEVWAWAHVQIDEDIGSIDPADRYLAAPHLFRSRLLCPRRLAPQRNWIACVVPTFPAGQQALLGNANTNVVGPAWPSSGPVRLPVFDSWRFASGDRGDFEALVEKLVPRELPASVGRRDLDISDPGGGLPAVPNQTISYLGALVSPSAAPRPWTDPGQREMRAAIAARVDTTSPSAPDGEYDPLLHDPVVGPQLYGSLQSGRRRVPPDGGPFPWLRELNTGPADRSIAAIGAEVVRNDQEKLMDAAWSAVGALADVNRRLNATRLAAENGVHLERRVKASTDAVLLQVAGPALRRISTTTGHTALRDVTESQLPTGSTAGAFRRIGRPRTGLGARSGVARPAADVVARTLDASAGDIILAFRDVLPRVGADIADNKVEPEAVVQFIDELNEVHKYDGQRIPREGPEREPFASALRKNSIARRLKRVEPGRQRWKQNRTRGGLVNGERIVTLRPPTAERRPIRFTPRSPGVHRSLTDMVRTSLDVGAVLSQAIRQQINAPASAFTEDIPAQMWASPRFDVPIYERIRERSVEYLVPGVGSVPENTLGLLRVNNAYVEAAMVGVNHEMSREFLWREYPALLSGTWFHHFWNGPTDDIDPINEWNRGSALGGQPGGATANLVLLMKGALPRRYPSLTVYAQEAVRRTQESVPVRTTAAGSQVRIPLFAGTLQPGVVFYAFNLPEDTARGVVTGGHPGWFFAIEEEPKGIRFGLDVGEASERHSPPESWPELSWAHLSDADATADTRATFVKLAEHSHVNTGPLPTNSANPGDLDTWGSDAAAMARITLQRPVRVYAHADSMLPEPD